MARAFNGLLGNHLRLVSQSGWRHHTACHYCGLGRTRGPRLGVRMVVQYFALVTLTLVKKSERDLLREAKKKLTECHARRQTPRYSPYVLRHFWATIALKSGVDALTVATLMGHKDPSTPARTYQHLSHAPEHLLHYSRS